MQSIQAPEAPRLRSVRETAHRLGVSRRTLEREVCRKKFPPPLKIGSKSLYFVTDVECYVAKLREQREQPVA
jgi:predicted DNA-binding transcriptional regulator AlpA